MDMDNFTEYFKDFLLSYYKLYSKLYDKISIYNRIECINNDEYNLKYNNKKKKLFTKDIEEDKPNDILDLYNDKDIMNIRNMYYLFRSTVFNCTDDEIHKLVKSYIDIIKFAEKVFIYNNSDNNPLYCIINEDKMESTLVISNIDYTIRYEYIESFINIPNTESNTDNPLNFLYDNKPKSDKVLFINIYLIREYGDRMISEFKYIDGSSNNFKLEEDRILFNNICKITKDYIMESFDSILKQMAILYNAKNQIKLEGIMNYDKLLLWR